MKAIENNLVRRAVALIFLVLAASCSPGESELDRILKLQAEATGSLPPGTLITLEGTITEPGWDDPVAIRFEAMKPGMVRLSRGSGDSIFQEGYDGSRAWEQLGASSRASGAEGLAEEAIRHMAEWLLGMRSLLELKTDRGASIQLIDEDYLFPVDKGLIGLRITLADGFIEDVFLDPESYLIVKKRVSKSLRMWLATENFDTHFLDFQQHGPLMIATVREEHRSTDDAVVQRTDLQDITYTPMADSAYFAMPE